MTGLLRNDISLIGVPPFEDQSNESLDIQVWRSYVDSGSDPSRWPAMHMRIDKDIDAAQVRTLVEYTTRKPKSFHDRIDVWWSAQWQALDCLRGSPGNPLRLDLLSLELIPTRITEAWTRVLQSHSPFHLCAPLKYCEAKTLNVRVKPTVGFDFDSAAGNWALGGYVEELHLTVFYHSRTKRLSRSAAAKWHEKLSASIHAIVGKGFWDNAIYRLRKIKLRTVALSIDDETWDYQEEEKKHLPILSVLDADAAAPDSDVTDVIDITTSQHDPVIWRAHGNALIAACFVMESKAALAAPELINTRPLRGKRNQIGSVILRFAQIGLHKVVPPPPGEPGRGKTIYNCRLIEYLRWQTGQIRLAIYEARKLHSGPLEARLAVAIEDKKRKAAAPVPSV